jgi:O-antigen/teichoic acid export membrane protein
MERGGTQGVQFIVQIVLARLLLPKEYGLIALVMIFITLANVFVQSGFNVALIQKKDADDADFLQAINALERSDIFLKLEILRAIMGCFILGITISLGVYAMTWGMVVYGIASTFINAYPNKKLLNYSYIEQWKDIIPSLRISLFMGAVVYFLNFLNIDIWVILILQIITRYYIYWLGKVI